MPSLGLREFGRLLAGLSDASRYRQWLADRPTPLTAEESAAFLKSI